MPIQRAVVACGGTGGHVYPAIAIAREILVRNEGAALSFVGRASSFESSAVEREGLVLDALRIGRLVGQGLLTRARTLAELPVAVARASSILSRRRPDVVIGTGGFVSGPTVLAAALRRVPIVVQEQNAVTGLTNSILEALADRVALAHPANGKQPPKYRVTGNPVRAAFFDVPPYSVPSPFVVLVMGGSQGARRMNHVALDAAALLPDLRGRVRFVVQAGPRWEAESKERAASSPVDVEVVAYLHDVPARLAAAGLVVCRSGASTVAEICAAGRPSLLVPFPAAAGDHQTANARALADVRAAEWVSEAQFSAEELARRVRRALEEPTALVAMAVRARAVAHPDAAASVVALAEECVAERKEGRR